MHSIKSAAVLAASLLLAGPAYAQWMFERNGASATAFVLSDTGQRMALTCSADAPESFNLVLDMMAKRGGLQEPAPMGFSISGKRYRYRGSMEETADGLRRITVPAPFADRTQTRMRRDLQRGIRVSVEDQSSYRLHAFNLRGSTDAIEGWEAACQDIWNGPATLPEVAEATRDPVLPEPVREGAWRLERADGRFSAYAEGLAGDRIGLVCTPGADGRIDWVLDLIGGNDRPASVLTVEIAGPNARVELNGLRTTPRERGLQSFTARFERVDQRAILHDIGKGSGMISVLARDGRAVSALPLDGAPAIVGQLLETCRKGAD